MPYACLLKKENSVKENTARTAQICSCSCEQTELPSTYKYTYPKKSDCVCKGIWMQHSHFANSACFRYVWSVCDRINVMGEFKGYHFNIVSRNYMLLTIFFPCRSAVQFWFPVSHITKRKQKRVLLWLISDRIVKEAKLYTGRRAFKQGH